MSSHAAQFPNAVVAENRWVDAEHARAYLGSRDEIPHRAQGMTALAEFLPAEVGRVLDLGARLLTREPVTEDGWSWHILADPDGNEFCVLQPPGMPSA